ncbi:synaptic vesicle membrane protein VAT-1 homolog [Trichonephila clavata]|uniref:Synaptic vesicle membrane protein VAT-1 homolog n=1 Tax=Trichonephila clavata TaxID=2740835 RepID=A0A8X6L1D4_TRICU|nr:synaptic vesicle membrane protein VAT-1 homolog [Trichonephila clavata]
MQSYKENTIVTAIDYQNCDFVEEVLKISPKGVDVILDCLSGEDFTRARKCLKHMGRIVHIGISSMINDAFKTTLDKIIHLYQEKKVKPRIDPIWSFDEITEATKCMVERKNIGKIVLVPKKEDITEKVESYQN